MSMFGGLEEAGKAAWDAGGQLAEAEEDAAAAAGQTAAGFGDHVVATGAEFMSDYGARDDWDAAAQQHRTQAYNDWDDATVHAGKAADDVVGATPRDHTEDTGFQSEHDGSLTDDSGGSFGGGNFDGGDDLLGGADTLSSGDASGYTDAGSEVSGSGGGYADSGFEPTISGDDDNSWAE